MPKLTAGRRSEAQQRLPHWALAELGLARKRAVEGVREAMYCIDRMPAVADAERHHPESRGWSYLVELRVATFEQMVLTEKDLGLANQIRAFG